MSHKIFTDIREEELSIDKAINFVKDDKYGAIDSFLGIVRNNHNKREVTGITYDAHIPLAKKTLQLICEEAAGIWPETHYYVVHYKGHLNVGDISVLIAVGSTHRDESFEACRYVIEEIKTRLPIWKKEHYIDGISEWLPGHSLKDEVEQTTVCCGHCNS